MISAFRYEVARLTSLRSSLRAPAAAIGLSAALGLAAGLAVSAEAAPGTVALMRLLAAVPVLVAAVLLGAGASGHERHHGMRGVTLAIVPRRTRLAVAKTVVTVVVATLTGVAGSLAAAAAYSAAIGWAYAGDSTLIPAAAESGPVVAGLAPAAAAAAAAGLFGLAVGWLARWYRTSVVVGTAVAAVGVPLAAGWLVKMSAVADAVNHADTTVRGWPGLGTLLNPPVLSAWPQTQSHLHPTPPTSLATTALLAALAMAGLVAGAVRWRRG